MEQKKLMSELKRGVVHKAYLLYGDERFLVAHCAQAIEKAIFGDQTGTKDVFDSTTPAHIITMAADNLPFFASHRLIYVRDSKLFASGRKDDAETMANYLPNIPDHTVVVFVESEVDKRSKLYKQMDKTGITVDCQPPTPNELATWATRLAQKNGVTMTTPIASHFVRTVGVDMTALSQEMHKLAAYCGSGNEITVADINTICTQTFESRIFDLTKAMFAGRVSDALAMYQNMLRMKESPIMVLTMIIRQFRIILLATSAKKKGLTIIQTATAFNLRDFMVSEALEQGRKFTEDQLVGALKFCLKTDVDVKTGVIAPELGVELLIIKYGAAG